VTEEHSLAAQLRRSAEAHRTGALVVSGNRSGTIYLGAGRVTYAASSRTPDPTAGRSGAEATGLNETLALREATLDALTDIAASTMLRWQFRSQPIPVTALATPLPVATVLGETARRQAVLMQIAGVLAPDSVVVRTRDIGAFPVQITSDQWRLLAALGSGSSPRKVAMALGHSVFRTTMSLHELMVAGLLVPIDPHQAASRQLRRRASMLDAVRPAGASVRSAPGAP
jgi:hypothetical protein